MLSTLRSLLYHKNELISISTSTKQLSSRNCLNIDSILSTELPSLVAHVQAKVQLLTKYVLIFPKPAFMSWWSVPTLVAHGGGLSDFPRYGSKERMKFQLDLMKLKIYFEDYIAQLAEMSRKPTIVLCDRGLVDCAAYMTKEEYQALLDEQGWTWSQLRDKRYDSVIFMNTAAKGA